MVTQITMIPELRSWASSLLTDAEKRRLKLSTAITNQIKDSYLGITGTNRVDEYAVTEKMQNLYQAKHDHGFYLERSGGLSVEAGRRQGPRQSPATTHNNPAKPRNIPMRPQPASPHTSAPTAILGSEKWSSR